ncbi:MAG: DUF2201 family putative metallopeptidase [Bacteroidota bacterium]
MPALSASLQQRISNARIAIRSRSPFFGTLLLEAPIRPDPTVPLAATDGRALLLNPDPVAALSQEAFMGLLVHEVLHIALCHLPRRGERDRTQWNIAADMVVNDIVDKQGFALPEGGVHLPDDRPAWQTLSVEEIYACLQREAASTSSMAVASPGIASGTASSSDPLPSLPRQWRDLDADAPPDAPPTSSEAASVQSHWRQVVRRAAEMQRMKTLGDLPAGLQRCVEAATEPRINWQDMLWRFLVRTPVDFDHFDRRQIHRGLYLKTLTTKALQVYIGVDTSGSISNADLGRFMGEVHHIIRSYPHIQGQLYYMDADVYGPYELSSHTNLADLPPPQGGGGTSFVPLFDAIAAEQDMMARSPVLVCFTDGYGTFPDDPPPYPVLWVHQPGQRAADFPFGNAIPFITPTA